MSKQIFFVTGFPRSRTAWLATLLTWGDCFCFHDGLANIESLDELDEKFDSVPGNIVGNSDPANLLFHVELMRRYPEAKWLIINRPLKNCLDSAYRVSGLRLEHSKYDWLGLMESLKRECPYGTDLIEYSRLNDVDLLLEASNYLTGITMPKQRIQELIRLNIQVEPRLLKNVKSSTVNKMIKLHECVLA